MLRARGLFVAIAAVALFAFALPGSGQVDPNQPVTELYGGQPVVAGEVLIQFVGHVPPVDLPIEADADHIERIGGLGAHRVHSRSLDTAKLIARFARRADVEYVEPNYVLHAGQTTNDTYFNLLWGMLNTGQTIGGQAGIAGADISADQAWNVTTGSRANVVGVVDTGIDYTHPDLAANVWSAASQFTVTIGGRSLTCPAGTHGFNAIAFSCTPMDDNDHGTHVSGTIGAVGNNAAGVVGVNWLGSIMGLKFLGRNGSGTTSDAIDAIEFAVQAKAGGLANLRVLSNSWGGGGFSQSLLDEINRANNADMLFVVAAGNDGRNIDTTPSYPASYNAANIVAVAATDNRDQLASFSNYGASSVDLGAPGVYIASTVRNGGYAYMSGTSMATPHVSGAAALVLAACTLNTSALKTDILGHVDPIASLSGKTATGGRLNVFSAISACAGGATPDFTVSATPSSQTVVAGGATSYTITVTPENGFGSSVSFATSALPSGVTAAFQPTSVTGPGSTQMSVTTSTSTPAGTYPISVTAAGGGISHTTQVTLVVQAQTPPPAGDFTISASPGSLNLKRGATGSFTVTLTSVNGFAGAVSLATVTSPTPGPTGTPSPASVNVPAGGSATSRVTVVPGSTTGRFTITVIGTSGSLSHSTAVSVRVR